MEKKRKNGEMEKKWHKGEKKIMIIFIDYNKLNIPKNFLLNLDILLKLIHNFSLE